MPQLISIGARVRWWREYRKLDRRPFAKTVGMSYSTLADLENDRQEGSGFLHLIAAALRLNPYYLETGKGEPESEYAQEPAPIGQEWPFSLPRSKIDKLNRIERNYVESKLFEALAEIEAERRNAKRSS